MRVLSRDPRAGSAGLTGQLEIHEVILDPLVVWDLREVEVEG